MNIELNESFQKAFNIVEYTNKNLFITGKAGTGKSTFLNYLKENSKKKIVFLAPTGVSALNISGQTIHSFFNFKPDITFDKIKKLSSKKREIFKNLNTIVIDEISMVRADLLDYIDYFLRINIGKSLPFANVQMIFIGDLYQLPPVVNKNEKEIFKSLYKSFYFFDSNIFKNIKFEFLEFEKIYRQKDQNFINLLNSIRNKTAQEKELKEINKRVGIKFKDEDYLISLTPFNQEAYKMNEEKLLSLNNKIFSFKAYIEGSFNKDSYPTEEILKLSKNAQVMFLNNERDGLWVNGTLGIVEDIVYDKAVEENIIIVRLENEELVEVKLHKWEIFHYEYDEKNKKIKTKTVGVFKQYPLKLAWAITIHKSQGKTYKKVILDLKRGIFTSGQLYVALSRCQSMEGLSLKVPLKLNHIMTDWRVVKFLTEYQYGLSQEEISIEEKEKIIQETIQSKGKLEIIYLKKSNEKSIRVIKPINIGEYKFKDYSFIALKAFCLKENEERFFKIERIIKIKKIN